MTAKIVGSLGLILDIIGVVILFKFGFPQPDLSGESKLLLAGDDPDAPRRRKVWVVVSLVGLACLVGGFALQLWALWI